MTIPHISFLLYESSMTTQAIFERDTQNLSQHRHYVVKDVPTRWIDDMGLPTHGMADIANFIAEEVKDAPRGRHGTTTAIIHFAYLNRGVAYAASADLLLQEGLVVAVASTRMTARLTTEELVCHDNLVKMGGWRSSDPERKRYRLVWDGPDSLPRWALFETTYVTISRADPFDDGVLSPVDLGNGMTGFERDPVRPATVQGAILEIGRALKWPTAGDERAMRGDELRVSLGRIRTTRRALSALDEQGRERTPQSAAAMLTPLNDQDIEFYDSMLELAEEARHDEASFSEAIGKLGTYAIERLPEVYGERFKKRWAADVLKELPGVPAFAVS